MSYERCISESYLYVREQTELEVKRNEADGYVTVKDKGGSFTLILPPEKYENLKKLFLSL